MMLEMLKWPTMGAAPRYARPFVAVFVATVVACALVPANLWPFSNWELFSRLRGPIQNSWEAVAITPGGHTRGYSIRPHTACAPLLRSATARFGPATRLRIYHIERQLSDRRVGHAAPSFRTFAVTCTTEHSRASN